MIRRHLGAKAWLHLEAMTALLALAPSDTSNGMGGAATPNAWPHMERKKSPNRNATSVAADPDAASKTMVIVEH